MKIIFELQGNTVEFENDDVSDASEMGHAFGDGEEGHEYCLATTWQHFIGRAFHLIQQSGGILLLNGQQISAITFEDTNGSEVTKDTEVLLANGKALKLLKLLK